MNTRPAAARGREASERDPLLELQHVTAALSAAATATDVARVVVERAREALGATNAMLHACDGDVLRMLARGGEVAGGAGRFAVVPLASSLPLARVACTATARWVERDDPLAEPTSRACADAEAPSGVSSYAAIPLLVEGRVIGVVTFGHSGWHVFSESERVFAHAVAGQCAQALDRARLLERERLGNEQLKALLSAEKRTRDRIARLGALTAALARALTPADVLRVGVHDGCDLLGTDRALVYMRQGEALRVVAHKHLPGEAVRMPEVALDGDRLVAQAVRDGRSFFVSGIEEYEELDAEEARALREARRPMAFAILPLVLGDGAVGAIVYTFGEHYAFSLEERELMQVLATHLGQALERARQHERAEQANRTKDDFLAALSHELRTPLNAISGWTQLLRAGHLPEDKRAHALEVIERNARLQSRLVEDLLDTTRIMSGRLDLRLERIDPRVFVMTAIDAVRPCATDKGVTIEVSTAPGLPVVSGDAQRLTQVAWNLLTNAVKFTAPGKRVEVTLAREGAWLVLRVRDEGEGIAPAFLPHVFERFRQGGASPARRGGGLGLGLAITRTLVEMHDGTIEAASEGTGRGTEMIVRLPVRGTSGEHPRAERADACAASPELALEGKHVLVIEDEPDSRELVVALLAMHGARATGVESAAEAFERFLTDRPDLILSDVGLPGEDGLSLIRRIRELPDGARVPAVALTAFARAEDRDRACCAGFDAHLSKPFEPDALLSTMSQLLSRPG